jgi:hypothetical protein
MLPITLVLARAFARRLWAWVRRAPRALETLAPVGDGM